VCRSNFYRFTFSPESTRPVSHIYVGVSVVGAVTGQLLQLTLLLLASWLLEAAAIAQAQQQLRDDGNSARVAT
jgi:hypothetical protein